MGVHGASVAVIIGVPDGVEDLLSGADRVGVPGQEEQQIIFLGSQGDGLSLDPYRAGGGLQLQRADAQELLALAAAAEQGLDPLRKGPHLDGLGDVLVSPLPHSGDLTLLVLPGRDHQDRHRGEAADLPAGLNPVHDGHHNVQDHQGGVRVGPQQTHRLLAVRSLQNGIALLLQKIMNDHAPAFLIIRQYDFRDHCAFSFLCGIRISQRWMGVPKAWNFSS